MPFRTSLAAALIAAATVSLPAPAHADPPGPGPAPASASAPAPAPESASTPASATTKSGPSLGFALHRFQDDFGLGGTLSTPSVLHWLRLTAGGGVAWYPRAPAGNGALTWDPLGYGTLVLEAGPSFIATSVAALRPYGFGGVLGVAVPGDLSRTGFSLGGLGGFGLEARFLGVGGREGPVTYFFEMGGIGSGAVADRLPSHENLVSGFLLEAGFRVYP